MKWILPTLFAAASLALTPAAVTAMSHETKPGGTQQPTPSPAAYEHADDKAKFLRDTHDMGKHHGEEQRDEKGETEEHDKNKDKDKGKGEDKSKEIEKDKAKAKDKSKEKAKGKGDEAGKPAKDGASEADKLLEKVHGEKGQGHKAE